MKKNKYLIIVIIVSIILTLGLSYAFRITLKEYRNDNFRVQYDSTWKLDNDVNELKLIHKKTKSVLRIQSKELDTEYMDVSLKDIIIDIVDSIEKQNVDYKLINRKSNLDNDYESFSYLYENGMMQVLVNIYKNNNKLVIAYYEANSEYYDIVLDSVETLLNTLEIYTGTKVN